MKNNPLIILLVVALALITCLLVWSFAVPRGEEDALSTSALGADGGSIEASHEGSEDLNQANEDSGTSDDSGAHDRYEDSEPFESESNGCNDESYESVFISDDEAPVYKLDRYRDIISNGLFKLTLTEQRQIGGLSIPVITRIWFGDGYISMTEAETHNISTEIFINEEGAYMLDVAAGTADLISAAAIQVPTVDFNGYIFVESGYDTVSATLYEYERYLTPDGKTVDFLFLGDQLKKQKIYSSPDEYELIGIEITEDISDGRKGLPEKLDITDRR